MAHLIPIPFLVVTVLLFVWSRFTNHRRLELAAKPASSSLVVLIALLSLLIPESRLCYALLIALGLALSLGGDVALMLRTNRWFLIGLVLFLLAHVVYSIAFSIPSGFHAQDWLTAAALAAFGLLVLAYLWKGLGRMKGPVTVYVVVILFMVNRAISAFFGSGFSPTQAWLVGLGAILFMLSDLMLAVNRFRRPFRAEAASSLLYYAGQLLIALSPSYFA